MRKLWMVLACLSWVGVVQAQSASPEVFSNAGGSGTAGTATVDWTIGEPLTETISGTSSQITQGFHQPRYVLTELEPAVDAGISLSVYPNPASDYIWLEIRRDDADLLRVDLVDVSGKILKYETTVERDGRMSIDLSQVAIGNYFLRVLKQDGTPVKAFKIQKVY